MSEPKNGLIVYPDGIQKWFLNDRLHREDGPAMIYPNGTQIWYRDGHCHREDGPAAIYPDGMQFWYRFNRLHREDGPAAKYSGGTTAWWISDKRVSISITSYLDNLLSEKRELKLELGQISVPLFTIYIKIEIFFLN